jgi:RNA polymerase sigma factor (sigma-70 family)
VEDAEIVALYFARNEQAIPETSRKYGRLCLHTAARIVSHEEAEECVNDTWLQTWNTVPPQRPRHLGAYVLKIVRNLALNRWTASAAAKRGGNRPAAALAELEEVLSSGPSVEQEVDAVVLRECIQNFLAQEEKEPREMFLQRYWYFCTIAETARLHHCTQSRVKMTLSRMRNRLKEYLRQEGYEL